MFNEFNLSGLYPNGVRHMVGYDDAFHKLAEETGRPRRDAPTSAHIVFYCETGITTVYHPRPL